jgi:hypothetical protein
MRYSAGRLGNVGGITANPLVTIPAKELLYGLPYNHRRGRVLDMPSYEPAGRQPN